MIVYRLRSQQIAYDLYLPEENNGKALLYVPGLPGHPRRKTLGEALAKHGFTFFEMRFPGSWESDGTFSMDHCVRSLEEACDFIRKGTGTELRRGVQLHWPTQNIIFMGSSFGGGVVLSSRLEAPLTFVLFAPVTRLDNIKNSLVMLPSDEDDLFHLLSDGYRHAYRGLTKEDWTLFLGGHTLVNPENNLKALKNKRLLFVQGAKDQVIQSAHTDEFVAELQKKNIDARSIVLPEAGHGEELEEQSIGALVKVL